MVYYLKLITIFARVVKDDDDSEFSQGKYGKSYDDIRKEQLDEGHEKKRKTVKNAVTLITNVDIVNVKVDHIMMNRIAYVMVLMRIVIQVLAEIQTMRMIQATNNHQILTSLIIQTILNR